MSTYKKVIVYGCVYAPATIHRPEFNYFQRDFLNILGFGSFYILIFVLRFVCQVWKTACFFLIVKSEIDTQTQSYVKKMTLIKDFSLSLQCYLIIIFCFVQIKGSLSWKCVSNEYIVVETLIEKVDK